MPIFNVAFFPIAMVFALQGLFNAFLEKQESEKGDQQKMTIRHRMMIISEEFALSIVILSAFS